MRDSWSPFPVFREPPHGASSQTQDTQPKSPLYCHEVMRKCGFEGLWRRKGRSRAHASMRPAPRFSTVSPPANSAALPPAPRALSPADPTVALAAGMTPAGSAAASCLCAPGSSNSAACARRPRAAIWPFHQYPTSAVAIQCPPLPAHLR